MSRPCSICSHASRNDIDEALIHNVPFRAIEKQFGVGRMALSRHRDHIPAAAAKASEAAEVARGDALLERCKGLLAHAERLMDSAEKEGDRRTALTGVREARECIRLLAEVSHELETAPTIKILMSPEWIQVQTIILTALEPYPEARVRVAEALKGVSS